MAKWPQAGASRPFTQKERPTAMVLQGFTQWSSRMRDLLPDTAAMDASTTGLLVMLPVSIVLAYFAISSSKSTPTHFNGVPVRKARTLPTRVPILGDLPHILKNIPRRHDSVTDSCEREQGEPFAASIPGQPPSVVVYTVQAVEDVLKLQFENHPKGPTQRGVLRDILGHGIFAVDGEQWVHQRKTASNLFTARALRDTMAESMRRYSTVLLRVLQRAANDHSTIDMFKLLNVFTIEAFVKMGFGVEMKCLESGQDHPFQSAFDSAQRLLVARLQRPAWLWKLQRFLNVGNEAELKKDLAVIDSTVMDIIAKSLARRQQQPESGDAPPSGDIVSLFLDRFDGSDGNEFDPKLLRDIVVNFLIAGRDTTAQAMSWFFYNLSKQPSVAQKIRDEIKRVLPDLAVGRISAPSMDQVQQLIYLEATIKETLRLHPSVPIIIKSTLQDSVLSDGTFLAKGTSVVIPVYAMGRMTFIWGPDAKEFKPERWIDPTTHKIKNFSAFQFVSFNAGPRICLGMNLAMLEMKIVLASVLSRFSVDLVSPETVTYDNSLTLPVRGEMLARITKVTA